MYLEKNYNYLPNIRETQKEENTYKTINKKLKMRANLLNQRKTTYVNAIKSEEAAKIF